MNKKLLICTLILIGTYKAEVYPMNQQSLELINLAAAQAASDGSVISNKNKYVNTIEVEHPILGTRHILHTVEAAKPPRVIKDFSYASRVEEWANDPDQALINQGYNNPVHKNFTDPAFRDQVVYHHNFARKIDELLPTLAIVNLWKNKTTGGTDTQASITGSIEYPDGTSQNGCYSWAINERGICYHRCFTNTLHYSNVAAAAAEGTYNVEFPTLAAVLKKQKRKGK